MRYIAAHFDAWLDLFLRQIDTGVGPDCRAFGKWLPDCRSLGTAIAGTRPTNLKTESSICSFYGVSIQSLYWLHLSLCDP